MLKKQDWISVMMAQVWDDLSSRLCPGTLMNSVLSHSPKCHSNFRYDTVPEMLQCPDKDCAIIESMPCITPNVFILL